MCRDEAVATCSESSSNGHKRGPRGVRGPGQGVVPRMYGVARLILRDSDRAQDAVQDALVLAWRHVRALRDADAWDAWLHRLTVRACYRVSAQGKASGPGRAARGARPGARRSLRPLGVGRRARPPRAASCGRLSSTSGRCWCSTSTSASRIADVAGVLDIPVGTVKSRLNRGLETLRASMSAEPGVASQPGAGALRMTHVRRLRTALADPVAVRRRRRRTGPCA